MDQNQIACMGGTRIAVGLSAIIAVKPAPYTYGQNMKILSGGGTLEIVAPPAALSGASAVGWGTGYPVGATETISVSGPAVFYLAASGATMTVAMLDGYTTGASFTAGV